MFEEELKYFKIAKELNETHHDFLLENQLHFRGSINSFSLVSVSQKTPELGICGLKSKEQAEQFLEDLKYNKIMLKEPGRSTEEKNLQALIINHSLTHEGILPFGDFTFVTSEMAVFLADGKIVNDILAIDSNNNLAIIELKSSRDNKVKQQTINFEEKVIVPKSHFIKELVELITGKIWNGNTRKIAVWPAPKTSVTRKDEYAGRVELYNYKFEGVKTKEYIRMDRVIFTKEKLSMNYEINIKTDYLTFSNQVKNKLGDDFAEQAYLFFERAVFEAQKNLEHSAIADAEYAFALAQYAKDDFPVLYIIGFLCEVHIFTDQIKKAKFYYNLGLELLDKNSAKYDDDKASFDRLQDLMKGEDWKEKSDNKEVIDEGDLTDIST